MTAAPPRPTITLPPRPSMEGLFAGGFGASPGPMTLVSSLLSPDSNYSFSQLLAGAMASPPAQDGRPTSFFPDTAVDSSGIEMGSRDATDQDLGFKRSRPTSLVVAPSPLFTIPPGLSPSGLFNSPGFFPPHSPFGMSHQQARAQVTAEAALAQQPQMHIQADYQPPTVTAPSEALERRPSFNPSEGSGFQMVASTSNSTNSGMESAEARRARKKFPSHPLIADKPADDGYNWRKYGQKQVKGGECPRSYYKCSHLNCPVKKKVERSPDGLITEIIYKGQHNHDIPQPNNRGKDGNKLNANANVGGTELGLQNWEGNLNVSGEMMFAQTVPSGLGSNQELPVLPISSDSEEASGDVVREKEDYLVEPPSKRRNTESGDTDLPLSHKTITEPKIVVQTRSEVDLLDDGYKWRKYGQKVVKGNSHPRSYYKCTSAGCNVRKHVERASTDPKAVITTYEGKHNHGIPARRRSIRSTVNADAMPSKPGRIFSEEHYLLKDVNFESNDQRPATLRFKKEQIAVR